MRAGGPVEHSELPGPPPDHDLERPKAATMQVTSNNEQQEPDALAGTIERREVVRSAASAPGWEIVQVVSRIAPGDESGWHTHPGEEVGFVMTGNVHVRIKGRPMLFLQAGDVYLIEARIPHNATDVGPVAGRVLCTYVVEAGKPLSTLVEVSQ